MDLQNIQEQLNAEFSKSDTRIVFWFDNKGEYEEEVMELQLGEVKRHIPDGANWLYTKYLLNEYDEKSKYLVYAPFPRPSLIYMSRFHPTVFSLPEGRQQLQIFFIICPTIR